MKSLNFKQIGMSEILYFFGAGCICWGVTTALDMLSEGPASTFFTVVLNIIVGIALVAYVITKPEKTNNETYF